ncbi:MAG: efflux RND transporter periplasmic adaptor subunit, partial [Gemmataceae bacterium]
MNPGTRALPAGDGTPLGRRGKWSQRLLAASVLLGIGALALGFRSILYHRALSLAPKPSEAPPLTVRVQPLVSETVSSALTYSGPVKELEKAELSFRVGGTITGLHRVAGPDGKEHAIHEGDLVNQETILASLDTADFVRDRDVAAEKLATAGAYLAQQESEASLALLEFRRVEQLWKSNATSISSLDTAKTKQVSTALAVAGARRDRESARISLAQAEADISYCTIKSPFRQGTVAARFVDVG